MDTNRDATIDAVAMWGNLKTLAAAGGGTESLNLFQIQGCVDIVSLRCEVTTVLSAGPLTEAHFELWDGAAAIDLTLNTGVLTSLPVGSIFGKGDAAGVIMGVLNPTAGAMLEHATEKLVLKEFRIMQKAATATYLRLTYTNGGAGAATGQVRPAVIWRPVSQNGLVIPG